MTTGVPEEPALFDPHQSKIPADDPRLRLPQPRGRTLRKGPAIAIALSLGAAILLALVFALEPARPTEKRTPAEPQPAPPVVVPEVIRAAPDQPTRAQERSGVGEQRGRPEGRRQGTVDAHAQQRREQDFKAEAAGVLFNVGAGPSKGARPDAEGRAPQAEAERRDATRRAPEGAGSSDEPNLQGRKNAFIDPEGAPRTPDQNLHRVRRPRSPYQVMAGSIIPAVLVTGINSDLPGPVIGQVRENVYDTVSGNHLLIPQGSRLIATYDSMIAWGQERVLLCWNRLVFPDGRSLDLACMPAADLQGAAGLADEVDEHWWRILKGASIASLLAATTEVVAGNTQGFNPTVPQVWARNAAETVNNVGQQITHRNMNVQPTIAVRPGFSVNVIVTKDLVIEPYEGVR